MLGGPYYTVLLGRRDSLVSRTDSIHGHLPLPTDTVSHLIDLFAQCSFSAQKLIALSGAHTAGFSHCKEFAARMGVDAGGEPDPAADLRFADGIRRACADYTHRPTIVVLNDIMTPNKFDNMYFQNLQRGIGLLASDQALASDPRTAPFVHLYAANQSAFFHDFILTIEKLSVYSVKTGRSGEIHRRCDQFNSIST